MVMSLCLTGCCSTKCGPQWELAPKEMQPGYSQEQAEYRRKHDELMRALKGEKEHPFPVTIMRAPNE